MKIAISTEGNSVSPHFGRCPFFTIIDLEDGKVIKKEVIPNPGHEPGFIPQFLQNMGVECVIAGGAGKRAINLFQESGIQTILGVTGGVDEVIEKLKDGSLEGGESLCKPGLSKGHTGKECNHHSE
ncbi:MAG TPA: NifB/NifX family molybdenum-iron cluster-binding protein [Candidatus Atribacteria bacterium]|jgi:predicted Fe-Mo cluster-binding NifX family protein|nr:NifB/NifX family molybdenum-iron cluster-binding protein [Candidatus Atribacteria bacterium]HQD33464.1 NifB/NifX family molybdenum-iron cluster-binding protein [Candidatus Atribacteria bacterium]